MIKIIKTIEEMAFKYLPLIEKSRPKNRVFAFFKSQSDLRIRDFDIRLKVKFNNDILVCYSIEMFYDDNEQFIFTLNKDKETWQKNFNVSSFFYDQSKEIQDLRILLLKEYFIKPLQGILETTNYETKKLFKEHNII